MEKNWSLPQFKCAGLPPNETRVKWEQWKRSFKNIAKASKETDKTVLKCHLLAYGGVELQDVFYSIPGADVKEDKKNGIDPYKIAMKKLDEFFAPKRHDSYERHLFWNLNPETDESYSKYLIRLRRQADKCKFGSTELEAKSNAIIDKAIMRASPELKEKLLKKKNITLDELVTTVDTYIAVKEQAKDMSNSISSNTAFASNNNPGIAKSDLNAIQGQRKGGNEKDKGAGNRAKGKDECFRCGRSGHFGRDPNCPALDKICKKCGLKGHFGNKCRTKQNLKRSNPEKDDDKSKVSKIRCIREEDTSEGGTSAGSSFIFSIGDGDELIWCRIGGILVEMLIDSGAGHNVIDESTWKYLKKNGVRVQNMNPSVSKQLKAYAQTQPLDILGSFDAEIVISDVDKELRTNATFYVVKGGSQPLLGKVTATALGVLVLGLPSTRHCGVHAIGDLQFPKIKGLKLKIPIDNDVTPVSQHARRPPIALLDLVEKKIDELLKADIIERVQGHSHWVSPIVVISKDNGEIRLCVDMRQANKAVKRENHLMPTFEDFLPRLRYAKIFSRLDIKNAFHQIELSPESREITTFITHQGMYRYKRLMFGLSCAPEMFQKVMEQMLASCTNVLNYIDDIVVHGATAKEHDEALDLVLKTLSENGVLLNQDKCVFRMPQLEFLGHLISGEGIRPTVSKIEAIQRFRAPESKEEVRSFLGLVTFVSRFLPDCATITAPLRELICNNQPFRWEDVHSKALESLKQMMSDVQTLSYFNNTRRTRVIADASPVALGAILVQFDNGDAKGDRPYIIAYASKSLSPIERRYCQTEREALALVWAVERFQVYLIGRRFELETDHKPLEIIFKPTNRTCARIERWLLRLQSFTFKVIYRKGSLNVADPLSRLCAIVEADDFDPESETYVRAIMESAAIDTAEIEEASLNDAELQVVRQCLETGNWDKSEVKPYVPFKAELSIIGDMLVRGDKLIVPTCLRQRMLRLAHEGHPGEMMMKRRLRDRVWWPGMDAEANKVVKTCNGCQLVSAPSKPEPMKRRTLPSGPWIDLGIDFLGPLPSGEYLLVIIDYYSRYKEVEIMTKISAKNTIDKLDPIFTRLGYPRSITLDNAKQFVSEEFQEYCKERNIFLNHITPYWPQANGEVERQNRSLLKRIKISQAFRRNWKVDLREYLMMYYSTPHSVTGRTPTELCIGRTIRTKIPSLIDIATEPVDSELRDKDRLEKEKGKRQEDEARGAQTSQIEVGDTVWMKNLLPGNKLQTTFSPIPYKVIAKKDSMVTLESPESGKIYERNVAHVKKTPDSSPSVSVPESSTDDRTRDSLIAEPAPEHSSPSGNNTDVVPSSAAEPETPSNDKPSARPTRSRGRPRKLQDYVM